MLMWRKITIVRILILSKTIYDFNIIPTKIPIKFGIREYLLSLHEKKLHFFQKKRRKEWRGRKFPYHILRYKTKVIKMQFSNSTGTDN